MPHTHKSILLDIPVELGFLRKTNDKKDRIESSGNEFFNKVRKGYLKIAKSNRERFIKINGKNDIDKIHNQILINLNLE